MVEKTLFVIVAALVMAFCIWLAEKKKAGWIDNFSVALSMLIAMASAVLIGQLV